MNRQPPWDVLVAGELFLDLVMSGFASWPREGEESFANKYHKEIGGGAAITACGLSKLGLRTGILGSVGQEDGQWLLDRLQILGVDTSCIRTTALEPTAFTVSISTSADRTFFTYAGANREFHELLSDLSRIAEDARVRHIHLAHAPIPEDLQILFQTLSNHRWSFSLDVGWHPEWFADERVISALPLVDVFFPNEREAAAITGETEPTRMLQAFERMGMRRVALKLGSAGAALFWDGEITLQKPRPIDPVDSTGAGDCFDAGFLYAWLRGLESKQCLAAGTACGEMSARATGGIAGFPNRDELDTILCLAK